MHPHGRAPAGTFGRGPAPSAEVPLPAPPGATSARNPTSGSKRQVTRDHPVDAAGAACSPGHVLTHTGDMSETTGVTRCVLITGATGTIGPHLAEAGWEPMVPVAPVISPQDRQSTRLNSSHVAILYAV